MGMPANRAFQNRKSEHTFVVLIWQMKHDKWVKWQILHGARFAKTTANCSNSFYHFHLILSVSRPQWL